MKPFATFFCCFCIFHGCTHTCSQWHTHERAQQQDSRPISFVSILAHVARTCSVCLAQVFRAASVRQLAWNHQLRGRSTTTSATLGATENCLFALLPGVALWTPLVSHTPGPFLLCLKPQCNCSLRCRVGVLGWHLFKRGLFALYTVRILVDSSRFPINCDRCSKAPDLSAIEGLRMGPNDQRTQVPWPPPRSRDALEMDTRIACVRDPQGIRKGCGRGGGGSETAAGGTCRNPRRRGCGTGSFWSAARENGTAHPTNHCALVIFEIAAELERKTGGLELRVESRHAGSLICSTGHSPNARHREHQRAQDTDSCWPRDTATRADGVPKKSQRVKSMKASIPEHSLDTTIWTRSAAHHMLPAETLQSRSVARSLHSSRWILRHRDTLRRQGTWKSERTLERYVREGTFLHHQCLRRCGTPSSRPRSARAAFLQRASPPPTPAAPILELFRSVCKYRDSFIGDRRRFKSLCASQKTASTLHSSRRVSGVTTGDRPTHFQELARRT